MRKILLLLLAFVSLTLTLKAQTQSLEDMKLQLEQSDTLYEAEKYDEVLEICLSIGRSTERCDSEQERTVYVRSQILACRCYDQLERYQEGYELSKRLMATQLTDEEKKELSDAYVNSAYFLAVPMMKGKNTDYGKARALLEEVLPYANENDWTIVMNKIGASWYFEGSVYYRKQDYDKTKECARRGVEVFRKTGKVSDEIATLNLLADAYYYQYDLSSAMETYRYALSQAKEAGETDLQMNVLSDIWRLCNLIGDVQMAQECNVAMDSLAEQTTDEWSGMIVQGCQDYLQAEERLERWVRDRLPYMDANERKGFWSPLSELFTLMTPYALKAGELQTAFTRGCYDALVMSKAFLLDSERSLYDIIKREGTDEDMRQYMAIVAMKQQMKGWEKDYQQNADRILEASKQLEVMGRGLQARVRGYGNNTEFMDVDHEAVRQSLHKDETLIDFTDYETNPSGRHYAAYVVRQEQQYPLLMPLFDECQIDSLCIPQPYLYYDQEYSPAILQLLWTPLASQLHEGQTVYYVPSQLLFNIALESIPLADGTLLGDHYRFIRLSSARELVRMRKADTVAKERTAVLYGGLQYDVASTTMQGEAEKSGQSPFPLDEEDVVCGGGTFAYLPGSEEAIRKVERILGEHHWKVCTYTGAEGTEESFLAMNAHSPRILQLYTHGFYYTPDRASGIDYLKGFTDAMQLSGIVLSGGNAAWTGKELPDGVRGGILTAGTIAGMDLSGTELAVLSACQTGLGKATPEGLYGLQRAFKKAGVCTVVMSLWEISNNVSQEFMTIFYERLMAQNGGWDKQKAFRETKAIIRARHPEPYYWAAFVMLDGCF